MTSDLKQQSGFGIIEVLIATLLLGTLSLALVESTAVSFRLNKKSYKDSLAMKLAASTLEDFSLVDPASLTPDDSTETIVLVAPNVNLTVSTAVVVNDDESRTVTVNVSPPAGSLGGNASLETTFFLRGVQ